MPHYKLSTAMMFNLNANLTHSGQRRKWFKPMRGSVVYRIEQLARLNARAKSGFGMTGGMEAFTYGFSAENCKRAAANALLEHRALRQMSARKVRSFYWLDKAADCRREAVRRAA